MGNNIDIIGLEDLVNEYEEIHIAPNEYIKELIQKRNLPKFNYREGVDSSREITQIDWKKHEPSFILSYNYENSESDVVERLKNSKLANYNYVRIAFYDYDIFIKVEVKTFIEKWDDFIHASDETMVLSEDDELILEFDYNYNIYSNFEI